MIPRFKPRLGWEEFLALFLPRKNAVKLFEEAFAAKFRANDAVAFPYGRSALWAFLQAVGVADADVVMPAYTCSVVAHATSLSGNRPVFVDISLDDYNMDLELLEAAITERTRAVVATHLFGYPQDLDRIERIVRRAEEKYGNKIWLIQDCAHSFGAEWEGKLVGESGDVALYALNISKMMTSIFGGMLTFKDERLADRVRSWRDEHFRKPGLFKGILRCLYLIAVYVAFSEPIYDLTWWLQEKTPLLNRLTKAYHLDNEIHFPPDYLDHMLPVEARVGLTQLAKYDQIIDDRRNMAEWYEENLPRREGWVFPPIVDGATYSHYVVRVPDRAETVEEFARQGTHLGELIQYTVPGLPEYGYQASKFPNSELGSRYTVNFPVAGNLRKLIPQMRKSGENIDHTADSR